MRIKKKANTGDSKWPEKATMDNGLVFRIPQQRSFCDFSKKHGCSLAAVSIALQLFGIDKSPTEVYLWAKRNVPGYTGSKLTIHGCKAAINRMAKKKAAVWHPITGTARNKKAAIRRIRRAVRAGKIVLIETRNPIHTNVIIARRKGGVWNATNGKLVKTTIRKLVGDAYKCGAGQKDNWWPKAGGYVTVSPK